MAKYDVSLIQTISTSVTVEANDPAQAAELAYESEDMPGRMAHNAFGKTAVDEDGDWTATAVYDADNQVVWEEDPFARPPSDQDIAKAKADALIAFADAERDVRQTLPGPDTNPGRIASLNAEQRARDLAASIRAEAGIA